MSARAVRTIHKANRGPAITTTREAEYPDAAEERPVGAPDITPRERPRPRLGGGLQMRPGNRRHVLQVRPITGVGCCGDARKRALNKAAAPRLPRGYHRQGHRSSCPRASPLRPPPTTRFTTPDTFAAGRHQDFPEPVAQLKRGLI